MITTPRLLTAGEMARRLRVPVRWLKAEAEVGNIPHLKAESVLLFQADAVELVLVERAAASSATQEDNPVG